MRDSKPDNPHHPGPAAGPHTKDIGAVLKGWDYEPGTINVRKINGADGHPKIQMRVPLGLLQMEMTGRPDGQRPHGHDSLLDYFETQLKEHKAAHGTELGFTLNHDHWQALHEEASMYYHRYLSLFVLEEYAGVVRDTARNIEVLDFCARYSTEDTDRVYLEQYRPYIIMMNARAQATILYKDGRNAEALGVLKSALRSIKKFFTRFGQDDAYAESNEVKVLKRFAREIKAKLPVDPLQKLNSDLQKAIKHERYEDAARIRDEINRLSSLSPRP